MAPDFSGLTTDGSRVRLQDYRGKKLVLYFYPMDDTPGCTAQACSLRDRNAEIEAKGAAILGVSAQGVESHQRFTRKHKLSFPLLADTDRAVARAYGTIGGGLGGTLRGMLGIAERVTFIIDAQGRVAHVIDDVNTKEHAGQVLALL
jgi:peroxiredoxin Q/BCP